jgi:hypothetical protein
MPVGRCHINPAVLDRLAILCNDDGKRCRRRQHLGKLARCIRRNVQDRQNGGIQARGQGPKETEKRFDPPADAPTTTMSRFGKDAFSMGPV